jgi:hypothetical protein
MTVLLQHHTACLHMQSKQMTNQILSANIPANDFCSSVALVHMYVLTCIFPLCPATMGVVYELTLDNCYALDMHPVSPPLDG